MPNWGPERWLSVTAEDCGPFGVDEPSGLTFSLLQGADGLRGLMGDKGEKVRGRKLPTNHKYYFGINQSSYRPDDFQESHWIIDH